MFNLSRIIFLLFFLLISSLAGVALGTEARYSFGPDKSSIWFDADAVLHTFQGKAKKFQGSIQLKDPEDIASAQVQVEVEAAGIETGISKRDEIMRKSHLEVESNPLIVLKLNQVGRERVGQAPGAVTMKASGELLIHGVKRPIGLVFDLVMEKGLIKAQGNFAVKMTDFKISRPSFLFIRVRDEVKVFFEIVAEPK